MASDERGGTPAFSRRRLLEIGGAAGVATAVSGTPALAAARRLSARRATTINLVCEAGGKAELAKIVQLFKRQTGNTVNLVELPYNGLYNRIHSELSSGSLSFDVAALDVIWLPTFAGALQPVDDLFTAKVKADLFPSLVSGARIRGTYVGMPVWTNSEIVFYRKDLFANAANRKAFKARFGYKLAAPKTWKQYDDVSRFFTRGTKLYGTDVKGAVETEWLAHVLQAGSPGVVLDSSGKVIIDNKQHLAALRFYSDLHNRYKVDPPGAAQMDWAAAQNLFNQGKLAVTRFWAHAFPQIPKNAPVYGKVGVAPMIAGAAGVAGIPGPWYLSVPAKAKNADLATQFLKFSYDHNALAIESSLGLAARKSAFAKYAHRPGYQHFGALLTTLSAHATKGRPAHPKWQQIVDTVLVPMLQKSVAGSNVDYASLLKSAKSSTQRIVNS
jgi:ABC-type glycerol-3-phosphate transport system substrate-binding protein